jgi:hypothetical protein
MEKEAVFVIMLLLAAMTVSAADTAYIRGTLLNQDPDPAEPGRYVELRIKVEKFGNDPLKGLQFQMMEEYPFSFDLSDTSIKSAGNWAGYSDDEEYYTLYYKMRVSDDALQGAYELTVNYRSEGREWVRMGDYQIRVDEAEKPQFVLGTLVTSPVKLISDIEEAELTVQIENIGDGAAENVKVHLESPEGFEPSYSYSDESVLGTISAGGSEDAVFYLDIDEQLQGGIFDSTLVIRYTEENDEDNEYKQVEIPLQLTLKHKPVFEIGSIETMPSSIYPGSQVTIKMLISNTGGKEAESVSVRAFKDSSQPFEFEEKSDFIGKLEPGESGEVILKLDVDEDADAKRYKVDLEVRGIDGSEVIVQERSTTIQVERKAESTQESGPSSLIGGAVIGAILVVGVTGYVMGKQSKGSRKKGR